MRENRIEFLQSLRAIAFFFVFFYHIYPKTFSGGFLGVNLFFLISGFIITKILFEEKNINLSSIFFFLKKRFFKLFPYLLTTVFLTILFGYFFLGEKLFYELFISSFYSIFFISNFFYYNEFSYFDFYAKSNPLLHTWSLSIEFQFYFIFCLILFFFKKYYQNILFIFILFIIFYSLSLFFSKHVNALFYLPFFRFFEFILGSLAFLFSKKFKLKNFNLILTFSGLIIIIFYILFYDANNNLTLINSIIFFLGFLLIIVSKNRKTENVFKKIKVINFFGDQSYLLYLLHWPVIVIYKSYINSTILNFFDVIIISLIILIIHFGTKKLISNNSNLGNLILIFVIFVFLSIFSVFINSFIKKEVKLSEDYYTSAKTLKNNMKKKILIVGDSHAKHLYYGIKLRNKETKLLEIDIVSDSNFYTNLNNEVNNFQPNYLIYSMRWDHQKKLNKIKSEWYAIFDNKVFNFYQDKIEELSFNINEKINIIVVGSLPMLNYFNSPKDCSTRKIKFRQNDCSYSIINSSPLMISRKKFNEFMKTIENKSLYNFIDPFEIFCVSNKCSNISDKKYIYLDDNHLTKYGSEMFAQNLFLNYIN